MCGAQRTWARVQHKARPKGYKKKVFSLLSKVYRGTLFAGLPSQSRRFWVQCSINYCSQPQKGKSFMWSSLAGPLASWPSFNLPSCLLRKQVKKFNQPTKTKPQSCYYLSKRAALKNSWKGRELQNAPAQSCKILHHVSLGLLVSNTSSSGEFTGPGQQQPMASAKTVVASRKQDES